MTKQANTPGSCVSALPQAQPMIVKDPGSTEEQNRVFSYLPKLAASPPVKAFMDPEVTSTVWSDQMRKRMIEQMASGALHEVEGALKRDL